MQNNQALFCRSHFVDLQKQKQTCTETKIIVQMKVDSFAKERENGFRLEKGLKLQVAHAMLQLILKD